MSDYYTPPIADPPEDDDDPYDRADAEYEKEYDEGD